MNKHIELFINNNTHAKLKTFRVWEQEVTL